MNQKIQNRLSGIEGISWDTDQYPQIQCSLNLKESMKHEFQKGLNVQILCKSEGEQNPRDFEAAVFDALNFCFFENQEMAICTKWRETSPMVLENDIQIKKMDMLFDVMIFQKQLEQEQNPVGTLNQWLKTLYGNIKIPGEDSLGETWKKDADVPVVYSRLESIVPGTYPDTWDTSWLMAGIRIHVIGDYPERTFYIKEISQRLAKIKQLKMKDGGPLFIHRINYNDTMNPLKNRQFFIECQYGVLKEEVLAEPIRNVQIQEETYE